MPVSMVKSNFLPIFSVMQNEEKKRDVWDRISKLQEIIPAIKCPICGNNKFTVVDGYFLNSVQPKLDNSFHLGGNAVSVIAIACRKCGFLSQHATEILDGSNEQSMKG